jgi:hypothetical protein
MAGASPFIFLIGRLMTPLSITEIRQWSHQNCFPELPGR